MCSSGRSRSGDLNEDIAYRNIKSRTRASFVIAGYIKTALSQADMTQSSLANNLGLKASRINDLLHHRKSSSGLYTGANLFILFEIEDLTGVSFADYISSNTSIEQANIGEIT